MAPGRLFQQQVSQAWDYVKSILHPNFYRLHLSYFVASILISSLILWGANTSDFHVRYVDALFLSCSAMCNVGLNTINLGSINGFQQSVLFVLMLMGDLSLVPISVVIVRRYYFAKYMKEFVQHSKAGQKVARDIEGHHRAFQQTYSDVSSSSREQLRPRNNESHVKQRNAEGHPPEYSRHHLGYGGFPSPWNNGLYKKVVGSLFDRFESKQNLQHPYLTSEPKIDHKGRIHSLTRGQEEELGGVEYRALRLLTWLLPAYAIFWISLILVVMTPYAALTNVGNVIREAQPGHLDPAWWSVFASVSAYTNRGLNLLNDNMISLSNNYLILIFTGMIVLTGNVLYPVFLRGGVWSLSKFVPKHSEMHHTLMFLLQHPRRCYLFLFPAKTTWMLLFVQIAINLTAWFLYIILDINYTPIDPLIPTGLRWFQGLYQAHGLRASGFYIITIGNTAPALQFFYMVTMYISAFPIILSIRQTNVYEERSIG